MPDNWAAQGNCKSETGVIKGAYVRLFLGEYAMARVYKDGINVMTVRVNDRGFPVAHFGPHVLGTVRANGTIDYSMAA